MTLRLEPVVRVLGKFYWDFRVIVWRQAIRGIQDFPLTGMGMGTFRHSVKVFYPLPVSPTWDIAHAHNAFLQVALDVGLPGLAAYAAIWLLITRTIVSCLRRARDQMRALAFGFSGCLVSCFVYSLLDTVALGAKPGFLWWMMLGMIVSLERLCKGRVTIELAP
jgi:putative inorganic carbon (HCO3(-)) transporter